MKIISRHLKTFKIFDIIISSKEKFKKLLGEKDKLEKLKNFWYNKITK